MAFFPDQNGNRPSFQSTVHRQRHGGYCLSGLYNFLMKGLKYNNISALAMGNIKELKLEKDREITYLYHFWTNIH